MSREVTPLTDTIDLVANFPRRATDGRRGKPSAGRSGVVVGLLTVALFTIFGFAMWTAFQVPVSVERVVAGAGELDDVSSLGRHAGIFIVIETLLGITFAIVVAVIVRRYWALLTDERAQAQHDALHDALTGLPNRVLLADRFAQALRDSARRGTQTALLLIDLDRFKEINDTFGHHFGDEVLIQVGGRMNSVLRDSDTVARLGGDEFAVVLPEINDLDAASEVARKLHRSLETSFRVEGIDLNVEASIGVVLSGEHGEDVATLMQRADIAMYVAKSKNLGEFIYDPEADDTSPTRLVLLGEMRRALEQNELLLHYQPKISIETGEIVGAEALIRWQHPTRGLVYPGDFIPVAEHTGLITPLTAYLLDTALAQAHRWVVSGRPISVAINLSARNLLDDDLYDQIVMQLLRHNVPPSLLELEVTESAIITDPRRARMLLQQLADLGVRISIDDFGAGYTSLSQLKTLPLTELKIDRSYVMTMAQDTRNALIVRTIVELGHNLGLSVVAEGVEDAQTRNMLQEYRCDIAQGFYYSRAVSVEEFDRFRDSHVRDSAPL